MTGGKQQPDKTSLPNVTAEGSYKLDDTRQEVRATVGPGEIIIRDKNKQTELEASGQADDLESLNRDPDKAYEITKDKHVGIEYYISDSSMQSAYNAGRSTYEFISEVLADMRNDNFISESDYGVASTLIAYKDDPNVLKQLEICSQSHTFYQNGFRDWIVPSAHASVGCPLVLPDGSRHVISQSGALTCLGTFTSATEGMTQIAAGGGTPSHNQAQNKQVRDIVVSMGLNKQQQRQLHDEISGQNFSFQEIRAIAIDMFGK